jgi:hypothetical protein
MRKFHPEVNIGRSLLPCSTYGRDEMHIIIQFVNMKKLDLWESKVLIGG